MIERSLEVGPLARLWALQFSGPPEGELRASGWRLSPEQMAILDWQIRYRQRGRIEAALRRFARNTLQRLGRV